MTTRWWAPAGAHIGPDDYDLALLAPGGEARYDLGAALFALHRTGAAACEVVAASPIPDQHTLINNLALARQVVAPPLVECIAKSLGSTPYAGLLVRDVADDAERAAVDLFNAAVAKGVAPPLAAQRVGMVYGVPGSDLGTYRTLACTPAANPAALADAADRALFGFVEKLCTDEAPENTVVVQKDVATERRNARGEWVKTATGNLIPAAEMLPETVVKPEPAKVERNQRNDRNSRNQRNERTSRSATTQTAAPARSLTRSATSRARSKTKPMTTLKINLKRDLKPDEAQTAVVGSATEVHSGELTYPEARTGALGFVLPVDGYKRLMGSMSRNSHGYQLFRGEALNDLVDGSVHGDQQHTSKIISQSMAMQYQREVTGASAEVFTDQIRDNEIPNYSQTDKRAPSEDEQDVIAERALDLVKNVLTTELPYEGPNFLAHAKAERNMATQAYRNPEDNGWIVVYQPYDSEAETATDYGTINEVMIETENNRVHIQNGKNSRAAAYNALGLNDTVTVDPNQAYKIIGQTEHFDSHTNTKIITHVVTPVDESEFRKYDKDERRDAAGHWTRGSVLLEERVLEPVVERAVAPKPDEPRRERNDRNQRNERNQRNSRSTARAQVIPGLSLSRSKSRSKTVTLSSSAASALAEGVRSKLKPESDEDGLLKLTNRYSIMSPDQFNELLKHGTTRRGNVAYSSYNPPSFLGVTTEDAQDYLFEHHQVHGSPSGDLLEPDMHRAVDNLILEQEAGAGRTVMSRHILPDRDGAPRLEGGHWMQFGADLAAFMEKDPRAVQIVIEADDPSTPYLYTAKTNDIEPPPMTLIVHDTGQYPDDADGLHFVETTRWNKMPSGFHTVDTKSGLINPVINIYRLVDHRDDGDDE